MKVVTVLFGICFFLLLTPKQICAYQEVPFNDKREMTVRLMRLIVCLATACLAVSTHCCLDVLFGLT